MDRALTTVLRTCMDSLTVEGQQLRCQKPLHHEGTHAAGTAVLGVAWSRA